jgi:methanogen homocitrate synthase
LEFLAKDPEDQTMWTSSPYNAETPPTGSDIPETINIQDSTLREGSQEVGFPLRLQDKIAIARKLDEIGIPEIDAGALLKGYGYEDEIKAIQAIAKENLTAKIFVVCFDIDQIDEARRLGVSGVNLPFSLSPMTRRVRGIAKESTESPIVQFAEYAKAHGLLVVYTAVDAGRATEEVLLSYMKAGSEAKVHRLGIYDTSGSLTPWGFSTVVRKVKGVAKSLPIEVHPHNDYGLATACALESVRAGAKSVSCTVHGMGERSGNAALEEVVIGARVLLGINLPLNFAKLYELSQLIQSVSTFKLHPHKALVGENSFTQGVPSHVDGIMKYPFSFRSLSPEFIGRKDRVVFDELTSRPHITLLLKQTQLKANDAQIDQIAKMTRDIAYSRRKPLEDFEVEAIARTLISSN